MLPEGPSFPLAHDSQEPRCTREDEAVLDFSNCSEKLIYGDLLELIEPTVMKQMELQPLDSRRLL